MNEHKAEALLNDSEKHLAAGDPMQHSEIWFEQCPAARDLEFEFGVPPALDDLIGEKFVQFVEAAGTNADDREELPAFIAEIKTIFEAWQLAEYLDNARHSTPPDPPTTAKPNPAPAETALCLASIRPPDEPSIH